MQTKKQMHTEIMTVTPALAKMWLTKNTNNRNLRMDVAHRYARDMADGKWVSSHQGIAFYDDGTLADGQHRLFAVTVYGKPIKMVVTTHVPRAAGGTIDQHTPRLAHDAIRIAGGDDWISRDIVALARVLLSKMGTNVHGRSIVEINDFVQKYGDSLRFAHDLGTNKRRHLTSSKVLANYVCADLAGVPRDTLTRFADIMVHGEINGPHENAAIRLREYLLHVGTPAWVAGARIETSKKVQRAISLFTEGKPVSKLVMPEHLTYPIPE